MKLGFIGPMVFMFEIIKNISINQIVVGMHFIKFRLIINRC